MVLENGGREDSVTNKVRRRKRNSGSFVIPMCTGEEGLLLVEVHLHNKVMYREMGGENVKLEFEGQNITCENDLRRLVERIDCDAEFANQLEKYGIKDEYIDEKEIIRIYRKKSGSMKIIFKEKRRVNMRKQFVQWITLK